MKTVFSTLPELYLFHTDAETAPKTGQWNFTLLEFLFQLEEFTFQDPTRGDTAGLLGDPGADLAIARPAVELLHHFERRQTLCLADYHHLPLQHMPGKQQADMGIFFDLMCFATTQVGIKHQPFFVIVL